MENPNIVPKEQDKFTKAKKFLENFSSKILEVKKLENKGIFGFVIKTRSQKAVIQLKTELTKKIGPFYYFVVEGDVRSFKATIPLSKEKEFKFKDCETENQQNNKTQSYFINRIKKNNDLVFPEIPSDPIPKKKNLIEKSLHKTKPKVYVKKPEKIKQTRAEKIAYKKIWYARKIQKEIELGIRKPRTANKNNHPYLKPKTIENIEFIGGYYDGSKIEDCIKMRTQIVKFLHFSGFVSAGKDYTLRVRNNKMKENIISVNANTNQSKTEMINQLKKYNLAHRLNTKKHTKTFFLFVDKFPSFKVNLI